MLYIVIAIVVSIVSLFIISLVSLIIKKHKISKKGVIISVTLIGVLILAIPILTVLTSFFVELFSRFSANFTNKLVVDFNKEIMIGDFLYLLVSFMGILITSLLSYLLYRSTEKNRLKIEEIEKKELKQAKTYISMDLKYHLLHTLQYPDGNIMVKQDFLQKLSLLGECLNDNEVDYLKQLYWELIYDHSRIIDNYFIEEVKSKPKIIRFTKEVLNDELKIILSKLDEVNQNSVVLTNKNKYYEDYIYETLNFSNIINLDISSIINQIEEDNKEYKSVNKEIATSCIKGLSDFTDFIGNLSQKLTINEDEIANDIIKTIDKYRVRFKFSNNEVDLISDEIFDNLPRLNTLLKNCTPLACVNVSIISDKNDREIFRYYIVQSNAGLGCVVELYPYNIKGDKTSLFHQVFTFANLDNEKLYHAAECDPSSNYNYYENLQVYSKKSSIYGVHK